MERIPRTGDICQHFKGNLYRVLTLARHTETDEELVIYQALYGDFAVYARPLSSFMERLDAGKYPQDAGRERFALVPDGGMPLQPVSAVPSAGKAETPVETPAARQAPRPEQAAADTPEEAQAESFLDPGLTAFLDADSYEKKLDIFSSLRGRADKDMLNTIAVSLDLELSEGTVEEQYETLKNCLLMLERYECSRLR